MIPDYITYTTWMQYIDGNRLLSELTIPGTHDTGTWKMGGSYQCQTMDLNKQLQVGIRFLDIRLKPSGKNNELEVWHGLGNAHLVFKENIADVCKHFLHENPSETIIMCIKDESKSKTDGQEKKFYNELKKEIDSYSSLNLFYTEDKIPRLNDVRGKIVFLRRCWAPLTSNPFGINAFDDWPKNKEDSWTSSAGINFHVQDNFEYFWRKGSKFHDHVEPLLMDAQKNSNSLFINFTSETGTFTVKDFASTTNKLLFNYLTANPPTYRYGIIPMDFPENQPLLIKTLIDFNFNEPMGFASARNRKTGATYLNFDNKLHHILSPDVANQILGEKWTDRIASFDFQIEYNRSNNIIDAKIVTFNTGGLYLYYKLDEETSFNLKHIPNPEVAATFNLFGSAINEGNKEEYHEKSPLTQGGSYYLNFYRVKNLASVREYLVFDGKLHHIPSVEIENKILGTLYSGSYVKFSFSDDPIDNVNIGDPLNDGKILKFADSDELYLCYKINGMDKPILRHIPSIEIAYLFGLVGVPELGTDINNYQIGLSLTH